MDHRKIRTAFVMLCLAVLLGPIQLRADLTSVPITSPQVEQDPYKYTGLIKSRDITGYVIGGSGSVVRYSNIVLSCAHVVFNEDLLDPWTSRVRWHWKYHGTSEPLEKDGKLLRGYTKVAGYQLAAETYGISSSPAFEWDVVAHYAYESLAGGEYAGWSADGVAALRASGSKMITGYPAALYPEGFPERYKMHVTGPFPTLLTVALGAYLRATGLSTGSGNSGGPVWVQSGSGAWLVAGVLVSGLESGSGGSINLIGVRGMDAEAWTLVADALGAMPPSNDNFANGVVISGPALTASSSNIGATKEAGEPDHADNGGGKSIWYFWTAPTTSSVTIDTIGSSFDTTLAVYTGSSVSSLTRVAFNDDINFATGNSRVTFLPTVGTVYRIAVDGYQGDSGRITLNLWQGLQLTSPPQPRTVTLGESLTLSLAATGTSPLTYQWLKDGVNLAGATNSSYTNLNVQANDAGAYSVVVKDAVGGSVSSTSIPVALTVPYTITTWAGLAGSLGSVNGAGTAARFGYPAGVALGAAGNVYVADTENHTIRTITPSGVVSILAGVENSLSGSADGIRGAARFNFPRGVAADGAGNVYVADTDNHTIRKITPSGIVSTLAGLALNHGTADGMGSAARFNYPSGIAVDSTGSIYVADTYNSTIRMITPSGEVSTLAGLALSPGSANGTRSLARFNCPSGVAVDRAGNLYVADTLNHLIRKITPAGLVTTVAGLVSRLGSTDGAGNAALFGYPQGIAVDSMGNVLVAEKYNDTIRKITPGGVVGTLAGSSLALPGSTDGKGSVARFRSPAGVAVDSVGNVYVADTLNATIRKALPGVAIVTQPQSQTIPAGPSVTFSVVATSPLPLTYQWKKNDVSLTDQTGAILRFNSPQASDAGTYTVEVTSGGVPVASNPAILTVVGSVDETAPTIIITSPGNNTAVTNNTITVSGTASDAGRGDSGIAEVTRNGQHANGDTATGANTANWSLSVSLVPGPNLITVNAKDNSPNKNSATATITINLQSVANQTITFQPIPDKTYGDAPFQLNATTSSGLPVRFVVVSGPASISGSTVTLNGTGLVRIQASQSGNDQINPAPNVEIAFVVVRAQALITWPAPANINVNTPLGPVQFNATANIPGVFSYSLPVGARLPVGTQLLLATFTPADSNYVTTTATNSITVDKATPNITWSKPADLAPGTALSGAQLNATADTIGTFVYSPPAGTVLSAGDNQILNLFFTADDSGNFKSASASVTINVRAGGATTVPAILAQPVSVTASPGANVTFSVTATNASSYQWQKDGANVSGATSVNLALNNVQTSNAGDYRVVVFNSAGSVTSAAATLTVVNRANPIIVWSNPANIPFNTPLGTVHLNATASFAGTNVTGIFTYAPPTGTKLPAGTSSLSVTFTPIDVSLDSATASVQITVDKATPIVSWSNPAEITLGIALSSAQLNATADTAGSFVYSPAAGTILSTGENQVLGVFFFPNDSANYRSGNANVSINVRAPGQAPVITAQPANITVTAGTSAAFTVVATGGASYQWQKDGANISGATSATLSLISVQAADAGTYAVVISNSSGSVTSLSARLTVASRTPSGIRGDIDGDGNADLLFQDANGDLAAWFMNGITLRSATSLSPGNIGDANYRAVGSGDFNGDGKEDLLCQHADGTLSVWYLNGTSQIGSDLLSPSNPGDRNWRGVAIADVNKDGKMDILFQHTDGRLAAWFMNGINLTSAAELSPSNPGDPNWRAVGAGDFNADDNADLVFQHTDGTFAVWLLNGTQLAQATVFSPSNPGDRNWRVVAVADQNKDGKPDLIFQHTDGTLAVWFMNGVQLTTAQLLSPTNPGITWRVVAPK